MLSIGWAIEHPAEAVHMPQAASVWKLPQIHQLLLAGAKKITMLQGLYGAVSAKPTTFAVFSLRAFEECLVRWRQRNADARKWIRLTGKNEKGEFNTMAAKAYPRALNMVLAESFVQRLIQLRASADVLDVDEVPGLLQAVEEIREAQRCSGSVMGYDFAPTQFLSWT